MPLLNLFFSFHGRVRRGDFWYAALLILSVFLVLTACFEGAFGSQGSLVLYVPLYWSLLAVSMKRYHDLNRSGWWLLLLLIPLIGPLWVGWSLLFRKGIQAENRYGPVPDREEFDYLVVGERGQKDKTIVNDVTGLNPIKVRETICP